MTPEGKVKADTTKLLLTYGLQPASKAGVVDEVATGWFFMPTTAGLGVKGIPDYLGHYQGRFFAIETKAPGKKPTGFQKLQIEAIRASGGTCFVIDGDVTELEEWLKS